MAFFGIGRGGGPPQLGGHHLPDLLHLGPGGPAPGHEDVVPAGGGFPLYLPPGGPDQTLGPVALDGAPHLLGGGDAHPAAALWPPAGVGHQQRRYLALSPAVDPHKIPVVVKGLGVFHLHGGGFFLWIGGGILSAAAGDGALDSRQLLAARAWVRRRSHRVGVGCGGTPLPLKRVPTLLLQVGDHFLLGDITAYRDRTLRPFARRRASTLRPLLVDIRLRKPWTLLRWRFLG